MDMKKRCVECGGDDFKFNNCVNCGTTLSNTLNLCSETPAAQPFKHIHVSDPSTRSDGSTADYYELPIQSTQLQELISHVDMNAQMGEIFRATYRYGKVSHSDKLRDAKKIKFYIEAEITRLIKLGDNK